MAALKGFEGISRDELKSLTEGLDSEVFGLFENLESLATKVLDERKNCRHSSGGGDWVYLHYLKCDIKALKKLKELIK